jgi:transcriptional regulator with XRE-family HTH domain
MDVLDPLFPHLVRVARTLLGWSQQDLADYAGVSVPLISRLEREARLGQARKLRQLRDALITAGVVFEVHEDSVGVRVEGAAARRLNGADHG